MCLKSFFHSLSSFVDVVSKINMKLLAQTLEPWDQKIRVLVVLFLPCLFIFKASRRTQDDFALGIKEFREEIHQ